MCNMDKPNRSQNDEPYFNMFCLCIWFNLILVTTSLQNLLQHPNKTCYNIPTKLVTISQQNLLQHPNRTRSLTQEFRHRRNPKFMNFVFLRLQLSTESLDWLQVPKLSYQDRILSYLIHLDDTRDSRFYWSKAKAGLARHWSGGHKTGIFKIQILMYFWK